MSKRLLIAASGTGGHIFPALAVAQHLSQPHTPETSTWSIEWLGVPDRLETELVHSYPLHTIGVGGFQGRPGLRTIKTGLNLIKGIWQTRKILKQGNFDGVFTTGGYIAGPAILAARSLGLPVVLHESNAMPGKVTRWFGPWCDSVAIGFPSAAQHLTKSQTQWTGTPVRANFWQPDPLDLPIPDTVPLIVVVGGSQGAVRVNQLVRDAAPAWFDAGAWVVHLTGNRDSDANQLNHPQYIALPFYNNMAALLKRADLAISRAGAGTLTELAASHTPAILIPYPTAADDHQTYNARSFVDAGAARLYPQSDLDGPTLQGLVMELLNDGDRRLRMTRNAAAAAVPDSGDRLADLIETTFAGHSQ
ncbi:MAG: undecaprenyldiphospho-muramoylpentapeptide beta-N-acetylglucosaminyltransferase [Cyanobacteria bacterium P01_C01_bin.89]